MTQENRGRNITSLVGFTRKINSFVSESKQKFLVYRGHDDHAFKIYPSVLRKPRFRKSEDKILRELVASHPDEFSSDASALDQLARAQHHSLPTRLLDVTTNPLVALYFAAQGSQKTKGEVIAFRVEQQKVKFFDSDTVSCIANLAYLSDFEKKTIDYSTSQEDSGEKNPSIDQLFQFIRREKPYFRDQIKIADLQTVLCVKPKMNSRRLQAQSGAFFIFGATGPLGDANQVKGIEFVRIRIAGEYKKKILSDLEHAGIHESSMFPEMEVKARHIRKNIRA